MKNLTVILLLLVFVSCTSEEEIEYPHDISPYLELGEVIYFDSEEDVVDQMVLSFIIWDLEDDFFYDTQITPPFHALDIIVDSNDKPVLISGNDYELPFYSVPFVYPNQAFLSEKVFFSNTDSRPEFNCHHYNIYSQDTVFIKQNDFHYNMRYGFFEDGRPIDFDGIYGDCLANFHFRVRNISDSFFTVKRVNRFSHEVSIKMGVNGLDGALGSRDFEMRFEVNDRKFNVSNIASTGSISINQIRMD